MCFPTDGSRPYRRAYTTSATTTTSGAVAIDFYCTHKADLSPVHSNLELLIAKIRVESRIAFVYRSNNQTLCRLANVIQLQYFFSLFEELLVKKYLC